MGHETCSDAAGHHACAYLRGLHCFPEQVGSAAGAAAAESVHCAGPAAAVQALPEPACSVAVVRRHGPEPGLPATRIVLLNLQQSLADSCQAVLQELVLRRMPYTKTDIICLTPVAKIDCTCIAYLRECCPAMSLHVLSNSF